MSPHTEPTKFGAHAYANFTDEPRPCQIRYREHELSMTVVRYIWVIRPPSASRTAPIVATFVAGPAIKNTSPAPSGAPSTKDAAIGTEHVAHTYNGTEITSAPSYSKTADSSIRDPRFLSHYWVRELISC